ncbi:MAG: TIGR03960 family B12-binding radical SAM protein [Clostridia bacterium]|nr:TIGR03960 family B12-binding radical SAM protein [Clostridia bacterium]
MTDLQLNKLLKGVQKPGRYTGGELNSVVKDKSEVDVRFAFCFPDTYEIGMSHLGMKILYSLLNTMDGVWCERVFAPWPDMSDNMKKAGQGVFALESLDEISKFDIIGFTLQYELCYTNMITMLRDSDIPIFAKDRHSLSQLVVAGGPCVCNAEPIADFVDAVFLGEGEEHLPKFVELYKQYKKENKSKQEFLKAASKIEGVYIPSLYTVTYNDDGTVKSVDAVDDAPMPIKKAIIRDLDKVFYPDNFVVPYIETVHDRAVQEVFRGCIRGCRFCQAGMIYRPVREKHADTVSKQAKCLCDSTGYDEVSLSSLSTSDYSEIEPLLNDMLDWTNKEKINISLPSLRIDSFSPELLEKISKIRKSGLTFAPEAGSQRMRNVINKNLDEETILNTCRTAFEGGHCSVKLYFMLGLPSETYEDIEAIGVLGQKIVDEFYNMPNRPKGKGVQVSISLATFVPKPHTPFQWMAQDEIEKVRDKQLHLVHSITTKKISVSWHESQTSLLEAVFARGDRRLSKVIARAVELGCRFDGWGEYFNMDLWQQAFKDSGLTMEFYANRERSYDELLPWQHLDYCVSKAFLMKENELAKQAITTDNCRQKCSGCGANKLLKGGKCFEEC